MVIDLFDEEQRIYDKALQRITQVKEGAAFDVAEYETLAKEYGRLLKQLRRSTRIADRTAIDLHESNLDLTDKIHYDVLTGIYNRRFLDENLKRVIRTQLRVGGELSVLMVDIDFFKRFNDTYGHNAGDVCLQSVAKALTDSIERTGDFAARYGGEEFTIVLPHTDERGAHTVAKKVLINVEALGIPHESSDVADHVTVSVGVATGTVVGLQSSIDYLKCADDALYMSKQGGRNRCTFLRLDEMQ